MVQRLAIARALLHDPEILLLDEPDTGLDPQAAEMLHGLLAELSRRQADGSERSASASLGDGAIERARTIVTVTHSIERGLALADKVVILTNGRVAFEAPVAGMTAADFRPIYDEKCASPAQPARGNGAGGGR
jgi:ABC-type multidrug transport system ATPase subunit